MKSSTYQLNTVSTYGDTTESVTIATFEHVADNDRMPIIGHTYTLTDTVAAALDVDALRDSLRSLNDHFFGGNIPSAVIDSTAKGISADPYTALNKLDTSADDIETYTVDRPYREGNMFVGLSRITREYKVTGKNGTPRTVGVRVEYADGESTREFDLRAPKGVINPRTFGAVAAFKLFVPYAAPWAEGIARQLYNSFDGKRARCRMEFVPIATGEAIARS